MRRVVPECAQYVQRLPKHYHVYAQEIYTIAVIIRGPKLWHCLLLKASRPRPVRRRIMETIKWSSESKFYSTLYHLTLNATVSVYYTSSKQCTIFWIVGRHYKPAWTDEMKEMVGWLHPLPLLLNYQDRTGSRYTFLYCPCKVWRNQLFAGCPSCCVTTRLVLFGSPRRN